MRIDNVGVEEQRIVTVKSESEFDILIPFPVEAEVEEGRCGD